MRMKSKFSMLAVILVVLVLVNSIPVSAVNLRGWQWFGLGNEESFSDQEMEQMYINDDGHIVITEEDGERNVYDEWKVDEDNNLVKVYKGGLGGWQYLERDDDENINYEEFVRIVNNNRNKHEDSLLKDRIEGVRTPVESDDNIKDPGAAKDFAEEKQAEDEEIEKVKEEAATATDDARSSFEDAKGKSRVYDYDGAIDDLDKSIDELEDAEQDARDKGLTSEAGKLKALRENAEKLKKSYAEKRNEEAAIAHAPEVGERNRLAREIADLEKDMEKARAEDDRDEYRRLAREIKELKSMKKKNEKIIRILLKYEEAEDDREKELKLELDFERGKLQLDKERRQLIENKQREVVRIAAENPRMAEKYNELRERGKEEDLDSLLKVIDEWETEQEAQEKYGITLEGKSFREVEREMRRRQKIQKEAQEAGLGAKEYEAITTNALSQEWDTDRFEQEIYAELAEQYNIPTAGRSTRQVKNDVEDRKRSMDAYLAEMDRYGISADLARERLSERLKGRTIEQREFEAAAEDEVEKEKIRQDINKFADAIAASDADDNQKGIYGKELESIVKESGKMSAEELEQEFDQFRVSVLKAEETAVAQQISNIYSEKLAPPRPEERPRPEPKGYRQELEKRINDEFKKPSPDYAKIAQWRKELGEFDDKYQSYKDKLTALDPDAEPKDATAFKSSGELDQAFELIDARSRARSMGIEPGETDDKTISQINKMMDSQSKVILQRKINAIDPKERKEQLDLSDQEVAALSFQAEKGDSQALALLIAGGKVEEAEKILEENPELANENPELVLYLKNLKENQVYGDEKFSFIKSIRAGKQSEAAQKINNLITAGQTKILENIGKEGTRYEGWTTVDSWTNTQTGTTTALVKNPKTEEYFIVDKDSTQRNEEAYRVPTGEFRGEDGKRYDYASPYVYYNAYREGTDVTPEPSRANPVGDVKLIKYGDNLYKGKIETGKEVGYVASIGERDADVAVFIRADSKRHSGKTVRKDLDRHTTGPFGSGFLGTAGKISLGDEVYVNNAGMVYNKDEGAVESSLYAPDTDNDGAVTAQDNIALANYDIDLGRNVRLYNTIATDPQTGEERYDYWACYEVRGQTVCEKTDLTSFVPKEFAGDRKGKALADRIKTRQRWQRAIGTFVTGPTGPAKYYSQKFTNWVYKEMEWQEEINRWMEGEWFRPEEWERMLCKSIVDEDRPDDAQMGFDTAGNQIISKRLQAEKEAMPDGSTLYQFNWMVRASNTNIMYTICVNTPDCDSSCLVLEGATDVAVPRGSSSSDYVPIYGPTGAEWVSICYREEILDDDGDPSGEFGPLMAFAQPIVEEDYVPEDTVTHSGDHPADGTSSTTIPSGAGTFGGQTQ